MNNNNYRFDLGHGISLSFCMVICTRNAEDKKEYHHCKSWNLRKNNSNNTQLANELTIEGEYGKNLDFGIFVKNLHGRIHPFFSNTSKKIKKFSDSQRLIIDIQYPDLRQETFTAFLEKLDNGTTVINVKPPERRRSHGEENQEIINASTPIAPNHNTKNAQKIIYDPFESRAAREQNNTYRKAKQNFSEKRNYSQKNGKNFRVGTPLGKYPFLGFSSRVS